MNIMKLKKFQFCLVMVILFGVLTNSYELLDSFGSVAGDTANPLYQGRFYDF